MKTKKPLVYIAGPITKPCPIKNMRQGLMMWKAFYQEGVITPFTPHTSVLQDAIFPMPYDNWLDYDFDIILHCDAVYRMSGESRGADLEVEFARKHNIPVFYNVRELYAWARGEEGVQLTIFDLDNA